MNIKLIIGVFLALLTLSACGTKEPAYTVISTGTLLSGTPIPTPTKRVVLTISGDISNANQGKRLDFDMDTLEKMKIVEYEVNDPFIKKKVKYSGVLLQDILEIAGYSKEATIIRASANDDYMTDIPLEALQWPIMVATRRDGQRMPHIEKGPLEIIFPNIAYEIDPMTYNFMWVWQLRELEIKP